MFGSCFATQVNVKEINQLDPETPTSEGIYQLVLLCRVRVELNKFIVVYLATS
jgi:hypothetical protein